MKTVFISVILLSVSCVPNIYKSLLLLQIHFVIVVQRMKNIQTFARFQSIINKNSLRIYEQINCYIIVYCCKTLDKKQTHLLLLVLCLQADNHQIKLFFVRLSIYIMTDNYVIAFRSMYFAKCWRVEAC